MPHEKGSRVDMEREALQAQYGLYMRHSQLAEVMDISTKSLSNTVRRSQVPNMVYLRHCIVRLGRRIRYPVICVAEALVLDSGEIERRLRQMEEGGTEEYE